MSGHDDLERQLRGSVRARATGAAPEPERPPRRSWWRGRPLLLIAVPAVLVAGVATAATQLGGGHSVGYQADRLVTNAYHRAGASCHRTFSSTLAPVIDALPGSRVTDVLPGLARRPAAAPPARALRRARTTAGGAVLLPTLRTYTFPGGVEVTLFASRGPAGAGRYVDADRCERATRAALVRARASTRPPVYAAALRIVRRMFDVGPGFEALHMVLVRPFRGGRGLTLGAEPSRRPGPVVRTGVWTGLGASHVTTYAGIVGPDVAAVHVDPASGTKTRVHRIAHPKHGVFVLTLPSRHGRMILREYGADGRYLRRGWFPR